MSLARASRSMNIAMDELQMKTTQTLPRIFLSYARTDREMAEQITAKLSADDYSIWWDKRILPGENFNERIGDAIDQASAVLVLWSEHSIKSPWVRWEASRGLKLGKLVPVAMPDLDLDDIRPPFNELDTLRLDDKSDLSAALARMRTRR